MNIKFSLFIVLATLAYGNMIFRGSEINFLQTSEESSTKVFDDPELYDLTSNNPIEKINDGSGLDILLFPNSSNSTGEDFQDPGVGILIVGNFSNNSTGVDQENEYGILIYGNDSDSNSTGDYQDYWDGTELTGFEDQENGENGAQEDESEKGESFGLIFLLSKS
jgi:hypothetical protein